MAQALIESVLDGLSHAVVSPAAGERVLAEICQRTWWQPGQGASHG